jgi:hypothetical protein
MLLIESFLDPNQQCAKWQQPTVSNRRIEAAPARMLLQTGSKARGLTETIVRDFV